MNKGVFNFGIILLCIFSLSCCSDRIRLGFEVSRFMGTTVIIPEDLVKVDSCGLKNAGEITGSPLQVIYFAPEECSICAIKNLYRYLPVFDLAKELGSFNTAIILSPPKIDKELVLYAAEKSGFKYPIYIDTSAAIPGQKVIPEDERLHSFLLDTKGHPICIGNPTSNENIYKVFLSALNSL